MIHLLVGQDDFLKREFIEELRKIFPPGSEISMNAEDFRADEGALPAFIEFLQTAPFLSDKRFAVLRSADDLEDEERERLRTFLSKLPATAEAVIVSDAPSIKKAAWLTDLSKDAKLISCQGPYENEWPGWIQSRAKKLGLQVDREAVAALLERAGRDSACQISALEQLLLYVHPRTDIKREDVEAILGKSAEADVFELLDLILEKKPSACLKKVADLRREGVKAFEVVAVLASQVEKLKKAFVMQKQGDAEQKIGQELKVHSFYLGKFMRQVARLNEKILQIFFRELADCDHDIKTGVLREDLAFEKLVMRLCV